MRTAKSSDTAGRALKVAQQLVQTRGFNGFSYADVAEALKITKAGLHYHFASKAVLGARLIDQYEHAFHECLRAIDAEGKPPRAKLRQYIEIYRSVLRGNRMCLCGMLAAEVATLPKAMRLGIDHFFAVNEGWLTKVLEDGAASGELRYPGTAGEVAQFLVGALEGHMMLARAHGTASRFDAAAKRLLSDIGA